MNSLKEQKSDPTPQSQYLAFYAHYLQQQQQRPSNPYAQIVSNVISSAAENAPDISKAPVVYEQPAAPRPESAGAAKKETLLSLAQDYGSESEGSGEEGEEELRTVVRAPPGETRMVIDKMASYVAKNGADFEAIVRSKGDSRFEFLNESHEYHGYYVGKIKEFAADGGGNAAGGEKGEEDGSGAKAAVKEKAKKVVGTY